MYNHSCDNCVFLGSYQFDDIKYDLYVCSNQEKKIATLVARYGDNKREYISGLHFAIAYEAKTRHDPNSKILYEALKRAEGEGYQR